MAANDLTTLDDVEGWLGLTVGTVPATDALLSRLITACSTYMQTAMSRTIAQTSYAETRNGMGGQRMVLLNQPVISIASLTIDGVSIPPRVPLSQPSTTQAGGYVNDETSLMLSGWYAFTAGFQNVAINYVAGYATVPYDIAQACIDTVGDWYKYKSRIGTLSESIEQQSISFTNTDFPARAKGVMLAYKRVSPIY